MNTQGAVDQQHMNTQGAVDQQHIDPEELGNAIGSTEPTVEDKAHWTPEMREAWKRDQAKDEAPNS